MASQHVPKVLPQAVAPQEALGMAGSREATFLGNLLFLFGETQRRYSLEEGPKKQRTQVQHVCLGFKVAHHRISETASAAKRIDKGRILKALGEPQCRMSSE